MTEVRHKIRIRDLRGVDSFPVDGSV